MDTINSNELVEVTLRQGNQHLGTLFKSDVLFLKSGMRQPVDDAVKDEIEEIKRLDKKSQSKIVVIVETSGGYVETVERIVSVFRQHYKTVEYVIPNHAYSAGTVLVMSGDEIHMDYYS
ncbi:MAG: ATP-dependent Clp protease proteolytic subunit, partial [Hyphomicrobiales bacterium]|nr:ATP-dependent Clp protease proteolytic subunit [Hyphomicrobiales bacterium]